jgi:hypothetical protein
MPAEWQLGHLIGAGLFGVATGVTVGWAAFSRPPPPLPPSNAALSIDSARAVSAAGVSSASLTEKVAEANPPPARPQPPERAQEAPADVPGASKEAVLEARIRALEKDLKEQKAALLDVTGQPLTEPKDLPDRFKQKALFDAVLSGFREVNPAAEVTSVDCTEYPCIVYGTGMSVGQAQALAKTSAFRSYEGDRNSLSIEDGTFAFFTTPKDDPNPREDIDHRVSSRISQMSYATKPR